MSLISVASRASGFGYKAAHQYRHTTFLIASLFRKDVNFAELLNANRYSDAGELLSEGVIWSAQLESGLLVLLWKQQRASALAILNTILFTNKSIPGSKARRHLDVPNSQMKAMSS